MYQSKTYGLYTKIMWYRKQKSFTQYILLGLTSSKFTFINSNVLVNFFPCFSYDNGKHLNTSVIIVIINCANIDSQNMAQFALVDIGQFESSSDWLQLFCEDNAYGK